MSVGVSVPAARPGYFPMLDSVRAIAAFGVLALHVSARTEAFGTGAAAKFFSHGDVGVPIFFVLSGLLLYRPFAAAHLGSTATPSPRSFYERRFLRIVPLYWVVLAFVAVVLRNVSLSSPALAARHGLLLDVYSSGWVRNDRWMQQTWSLATEIAFYAVLPLLALGIGAVVGRVRAPSRLQAELGLCALLAVVSFGIAWWLAATRQHGTVANTWLPAQGYLFAVGMLLAVVSVAPDAPLHRNLQQLARPAWAWWTVGAGAYLLVVFALHLPSDFAITPSVARQLAQRGLYALVAVCIIVPAAFGGTRGLGRKVLTSTPLRWLGIISYGIFLWHLDWLKQLEDWNVFTPPTGTVGFVAVLPAAAVLAVVAATATYVLVERTVQRRTHALRSSAVVSSR